MESFRESGTSFTGVGDPACCHGLPPPSKSLSRSLQLGGVTYGPLLFIDTYLLGCEPQEGPSWDNKPFFFLHNFGGLFTRSRARGQWPRQRVKHW